MTVVFYVFLVFALISYGFGIGLAVGLFLSKEQENEAIRERLAEISNKLDEDSDVEDLLRRFKDGREIRLESKDLRTTCSVD